MSDLRQKPMLAIETSSRRIKLALGYGGDRLVKLDEEVDRSHGQVIIRKIERLLQSAALAKSDIASIAVGVGPGSFTGLRIGLAVTKGIATALEIPVLSVSHFEIATYYLGSQYDQVMVLLPFKSDALFAARMSDGHLNPDKVNVISYEQVAGFVKSMPVAAVGFEPASDRGQAFTKAGIKLVQFDASAMITIGTEKLENGQIANIADLEPMYLQKSQAEIAREKRRNPQAR